MRGRECNINILNINKYRGIVYQSIKIKALDVQEDGREALPSTCVPRCQHLSAPVPVCTN